MAIKQQLLVSTLAQQMRIAGLENGVLQTLQIEREQHHNLVDNIYLGKVARVLPGMQAAFVDIGLDKNAFLHIDNVVLGRLSLQENNLTKPLPIEKCLREGESILVQAKKQPISDKGVRLTMQLSLASRNLVFFPLGEGIAVSNKISDAQHLIDCAEKLLADYPEKAGLIIRTAANSLELKTSQTLQKDFAYITQLWQQCSADLNKQKAPQLVYREPSLLLRVLRDVTQLTTSIKIDNKSAFRQATEFAEQFMPTLKNRLHYYQGERPLFDHYAVEAEISKALQPKVALKSGGDLIIEQTQSMTTVDVNTGSFVGRKDQQQTLLKTNLEAADEIARQLRMRNLGGIIIIDFIDLSDKVQQQQVHAALKKALARDVVPCSLSEMSSLGLIEVTRRRRQDSLQHILCEPCPVCEGHGQLKSAQSQSYDILQQLISKQQQHAAKQYTIYASRAVVELMQNTHQDFLSQLESVFDASIQLIIDKHCQYHYEIVSGEK